MTENHGATDTGGSNGKLTRVDISEVCETPLPAIGNIFRNLGLWFPLFFAPFILSFVIMFVVSAIFTRVPDAVYMTIFLGVTGLGLIFVLSQVRGAQDWVSGDTMLGAELDFSADDLGHRIEAFDRTLGDIFKDVHKFTSSRFPIDVAFVERSRRKAFLYRLLAGAVFVVAAFTVIGDPGNLGLGAKSLLGVVGFVAALAAITKASNVAKQHAQPSFEELREADDRKPVLLLRSFKDDTLIVLKHFKRWLWRYDRGIRFEQAIANRFSQIGPLIAVSAPGETVPELGAARKPLDEAEWQQQVMGWMNEASLIPMIAGPTEWIRWELNQILTKNHIDRLFILLSSNRLTHHPPLLKRWENVLGCFAGTPWWPALDRIDPEQTLLVSFGPEGRVFAVTSETGANYMRDYQVAITLGVYNRFLHQSVKYTDE